MTTEPKPLTPAEIQNADAGLTAYLQARARDYAVHGWGDGGLIEAREGAALLVTHIDTTLRRARAAERDRDRARAEATLLRHALGRILRDFTEKGHPGEPCLRSGWVPVGQIREARELLTVLAVAQPQGAAQPDAGGPARAPATTGPSNWSSPTQEAAAGVGHLPGHPGKLAEPPAWLKAEPTPRQPSPGHITAYKLDHCGSCRDAEFYGWSGLMAERAHAQHLGAIDVGPLAGQPCRCKRCTEPAGSGTPDA